MLWGYCWPFLHPCYSSISLPDRNLISLRFGEFKLKTACCFFSFPAFSLYPECAGLSLAFHWIRKRGYSKEVSLPYISQKMTLTCRSQSHSRPRRLSKLRRQFDLTKIGGPPSRISPKRCAYENICNAICIPDGAGAGSHRPAQISRSVN